LDTVGELDVEDLLEPLPQGRSQDREGDLDAMVEVPRHPVRGGEEVLLVAAIEEIVDARVLEEAIDDRDDADSLGQSGYAGPEAADPPDDQVDVHPRLARRAQLVDERAIDETVQLGDQPGPAPRSGVLGFTANLRDQRLPEPGGGDDEVVEPDRPGVTGEEVEQLGQVLAEGFPARKEPQVRVNPAGTDVVVACGDVTV